MRTKIIYGCCFQESTIYTTELGDIDGWTFCHIKIPEILKTMEASLHTGTYNCYVKKDTGIYVSIKDIADSHDSTLQLHPESLINQKINTDQYHEFLKLCQLKNPESFYPGFWVISNV